jgi:hypothetical protein
MMIFQTFKTLADVNATTDLSELLVYTNDVTGGWAMPLVLLAFFMIIFLGGLFIQSRRGIMRPEVLLATAGFLTFGMAMIMSIKEGLLNPIYVFISLGLAILGVLWMYLSD